MFTILIITTLHLHLLRLFFLQVTLCIKSYLTFVIFCRRTLVYYYTTILLFNSCCPTKLLYCSIDYLPSKNNKTSSASSKTLQPKSSGSSKTLQPKSSAKTREPTVQVKSKKKTKNISMALEVAMKRDSSNEVKRDNTWEPSSEDDI